MNSITVQGNLVRDVRVVYTEKGTPIINFCLADNGFVKGEKTVIFWNCIMFGENAERLGNEYMVGRQYIVKGIVVPDNYEKDGEKRYCYQLQVEGIKYGLKPKNKKGSL